MSVENNISLGSHLQIDAKQESSFQNELDMDALSKCWWQMQNELKRHNLSETEHYEIEFGIKRRKPINPSDHNSVIIRIRDRDVAFSLDLVLDSNAKPNDVSGLHVCPKPGCGWKTDSYREYNKHYLRHYSRQEAIVHTCCEREYAEYVLYLKHLYEKHRSTNPIGIHFERLITLNDEGVEDEKVAYFPCGVATITFHEVFKNALLILKNFGKYFIFFWNCEDYATWFLVFHGVPLSEIEPTLTDRSSSSSTPPASPGGIVDIKKRWHTEDTCRNQEIDEELGDYACGYVCEEEEECKYFPPMSRGDLKKHVHAAHNKTQEELNRQIRRKLLGCAAHEAVGTRDIVRFTLYRQKPKESVTHESLILQPWSVVDEPQRRTHFCRIHGCVNDAGGEDEQYREKLEIVSLTEVELNDLEHIVDFDINLETLYQLYYADAVEFAVQGSSSSDGSPQCNLL